MSQHKQSLSFALALLFANIVFIFAIIFNLFLDFFLDSTVLNIGLFVSIGFTAGLFVYGVSYVFEQKANRSLSGVSATALICSTVHITFYIAFSNLMMLGQQLKIDEAFKQAGQSDSITSFMHSLVATPTITSIISGLLLFVIISFAFHLFAAIASKQKKAIIEVVLFIIGTIFIIACIYITIALIGDNIAKNLLFSLT